MDRSPEEYFKAAQEAEQRGDFGQAMNLYQMAKAVDPRNPAYGEALKSLRVRMMEKASTSASGATQALPIVSQEDLNEMVAQSEAHHPAPRVQVGNRRPALMIGVLLLVVAAGGGYHWSQGVHVVSATRYQGVISGATATRSGSSTELVLTVPRDAWDALAVEKRRDRVKELLTLAGQEGYKQVFVFDPQKNRLASATPEMIWIGP